MGEGVERRRGSWGVGTVGWRTRSLAAEDEMICEKHIH